VARLPGETLEFLRTEPDPVLHRMAVMATEHRGWVNLRPLVHEPDEDADVPVRPGGLFGVFGGTGPPVPLCTWTPGEVRRRGVGPVAVGVQHGTGPKVVRRLAEVGAPVPDGWVVAQDHPRRGLVVHPPVEATPEAVLGWLLGAGEALCLLPVSGWWYAAVFGPED
jgi:hypothetical protein